MGGAVVSSSLLIVGAGASSVAAVRAALELESEGAWELCRVVMPDQYRDRIGHVDDWCVLVAEEDVDTADLDLDQATWAYAEVYDVAGALDAIERDHVSTRQELAVLGLVAS